MFSRWDIIWASRFPEQIKCTELSCGQFFSIEKHLCPFCQKENAISNIVAKRRPVLLWTDSNNWFESMAFCIPLSSSRLVNNKFNQIIKLDEITFIKTDEKYQVPMRAIICQSSRVDGTALRQGSLIAKVTDETTKRQIENKLLDWIL